MKAYGRVVRRLLPGLLVSALLTIALGVVVVRMARSQMPAETAVAAH